MNTQVEKGIPLSKRKMTLLTFGSVSLVLTGVYLMNLDEATIHTLRPFRSVILVHGIGALGIVFFGLCALVGIKKLFEVRPGLQFSASGFVDNSSGVAAGFIPWSEVTGVEIFQIRHQKNLVIKVLHPEKYMKRGSWIRQRSNEMNSKLCGSPIVIAPTALQIELEELQALFQSYISCYGVNAQPHLQVKPT